MSTWEEDKRQKRLERDIKKLNRVMAAPPSRSEVLSGENELRMNIASTAIAVEALELLLVERGILKDNEVLDKMKVLMEEKKMQAQAQAEAAPEPPRIIAPV